MKDRFPYDQDARDSIVPIQDSPASIHAGPEHRPVAIGHLSDRLGHKRVLIVGLFITGLMWGQ